MFQKISISRDHFDRPDADCIENFLNNDSFKTKLYSENSLPLVLR